jgi:hypothetical protein
VIGVVAEHDLGHPQDAIAQCFDFVLPSTVPPERVVSEVSADPVDLDDEAPLRVVEVDPRYEAVPVEDLLLLERQRQIMSL